jgi:hypothetical protein
MKIERYTESQVLHGLREAWEDMSGVGDPFDAQTQLYTYMKADGLWDEVDLADVFRHLEEFFGFACSDKEWTDFFGFDVYDRSADEWEKTVAPKLTFGALAQFIVARAPVVASFDPIPVFGGHCAPAGVFRGIERLAENVTCRRPRFSPSVKIIDVMRGHDLDEFWMHLRWMTEHAIPALPSFWRGVTFWAGCLGVLATIVALIAAWATSNSEWIAPTLVGACVAYAMAFAYKQVVNPLPADIVTFRDLATRIAGMRRQPSN